MLLIERKARASGWYLHGLLEGIMESRKRLCDLRFVGGMAGEETPGFYPCCWFWGKPPRPPSLSQEQDHRGANSLMCLAIVWP